MTLRDLLSMAFMNLWRRKVRAFLTMLGMVIGTASVVVMVSLGIGINVSYQESLEQTGSLTKITVSAQDWDSYYQQAETSGNSSSGGPETVDINDKTIAKIKAMDHVTAVTPILQTYYCYIKDSKFIGNPTVYGIDLSTAEAFGINISEGELCGSGSGSTIEMIAGSQVPFQFYNPTNYSSATNKDGTARVKLLTDNLKMTFDSNNVYSNGDSTAKKGKFYRLKVTGLIEEGNDYNLSYSCYMDVSALKKLLKDNKSYIYSDNSKTTYSEAWVKVDNVDNVTEVQNAIKEMGYGTSSLGDVLQQVQDSTKQLRALLGAIGGVALLVAAISIMNTMMMAIYERTKEIGIIKVLGCRMTDICALFLAESAYIGFFGGMLGVGVSYGLGAVLNKFFLESMNMRSVIPLWLTLGVWAFSVVVAMLSGLYPSLKAMKLSPLAAIRSE